MLSKTMIGQTRLRIKHIFSALTLAALFSANAFAQDVPLSQQMTKTVMKMWPDSFSNGGRPARWSYDQGVILKGVESVWRLYGDATYFNYIQHSMDHYVREDGTVKDYRPDEYNIDHLNNGKVVMTLYNVTGQQKYKKAIDLLRSQLNNHPRTKEGSFWHKKIYPWQVWLDGLYMGQPFYAEYEKLTGHEESFNDITRQFVTVEQHTRDAKTGLLYHAWDESKEQLWANKTTGTSPHFWARAMGWYGVALVDALDHYPAGHPGKDSLVGILKRFAKAIVSVQDKKTGVWYDILDLPNREKNYKESSASCMFIYALAKGIRLGYLPASFTKATKKGYDGIIKEFIEVDANGQTNLKATVTVSGLGGNPYRDGSFDYYMREKVITNDAKGMGAFIMAAAEMEMAAMPKPGKGKKVVLDNYFNHEMRSSFYGIPQQWHYTWDEMDLNGYSLFGDVFTTAGASLSSLKEAPTKENLKGASVYIIVDADNYKDNKSPNFMDDASAAAVAAWVKKGGSLIILANDSANSDLKHMNKLANKFGITFTDNSLNMVKGSEYEMGALYNNQPNPVFITTKKMYLKELSALSVTAPAQTVLTKDGSNIIAIAKYGKGAVFAVGDPWLYNEYTDGRKIAAEFQNFSAAQEIVKWLFKPVFK
jgi:unsaturated rhamnogalacturonyl hydrolase